MSNSFYAQDVSIDKIELIRTMLEGRGIDEQDLINRLNSKGLDVDNMTESDILANKTVIEETINQIQQTDGVNVIENNSIPVENIEENFFVEEEGTLPDSDLILNLENEISNNSKLENTYSSEIYGHNVFSEKFTDVYRISKDASPPNSYILASGDKINILIFGKSQGDYFFEVNKNGYIKPSKMPKIFIAGLTLKQAKEMLIKKFSEFYVFNKDQFALTLNTSRTISVNVFGEVNKTGSYVTSALNTLLNILSIAGGPTDFGSVRNIQIIRDNQRRSFDLYEFMRNPSIQFDFFLQDNDIIYVPPMKKLISIEGAVNRPMSYELKDNEGINQLIDFSGGLKANAYTGLIQVQSIEDNRINLKDYSVDDILSEKLNISLKDGDKTVCGQKLDSVGIIDCLEALKENWKQKRIV